METNEGTDAAVRLLEAIGPRSRRRRIRQRYKRTQQVDKSITDEATKQEFNREDGTSPEMTTVNNHFIHFAIPSGQNYQYVLNLEEVDLTRLLMDWTVSNGLPSYCPAMDSLIREEEAMEWVPFKLFMENVDGVSEFYMDEGQFKQTENNSPDVTIPKNDVEFNEADKENCQDSANLSNMNEAAIYTVAAENLILTEKRTKKDVNNNKKYKKEKASKEKKTKKKKKGKKEAEKDVPVKIQPRHEPITFIINSSNEDSWPKLGEKSPKCKHDEKTNCKKFERKTDKEMTELPQKKEVGGTREILMNVFGEEDQVILVVPLNNWHGIVHSSNNENLLFCSLCLEGFVGDEEFDRHVSQQKHLRLVQSPLFLAEKHGVRQLSCSLFHCILCNVALYDALGHISTEPHQIKSKKSEKYAANKAKKIKIEQDAEETKPKKREIKVIYDSEFSDGTEFYYCTKCDEELPNFKRQIIIHKNSPGHKTSLQKYQDKTKHKAENCKQKCVNTNRAAEIAEVEEKFFKKSKKNLKNINDFCTVCEVDAGKGNLEQHLLGESHRKRLGDIEAVPTPTFGNNICNQCHVVIPNNYANIRDHYEGNGHKKRLEQCLERNEVKDFEGRYKCEPCHATISKSVFSHHVSTIRHRIALKRYRRMPNYCHICNVWVHLKNKQLHNQGRRHRLNVESRTLRRFFLICSSV